MKKKNKNFDLTESSKFWNDDGSFCCMCLVHLMLKSLYETFSNVNFSFVGLFFVLSSSSIETTNLIASNKITLIFVNWQGVHCINELLNSQLPKLECMTLKLRWNAYTHTHTHALTIKWNKHSFVEEVQMGTFYAKENDIQSHNK